MDETTIRLHIEPLEEGGYAATITRSQEARSGMNPIVMIGKAPLNASRRSTPKNQDVPKTRRTFVAPILPLPRRRLHGSYALMARAPMHYS